VSLTTTNRGPNFLSGDQQEQPFMQVSAEYSVSSK
jgi:hypothetical protein